jgi:hypothetical protein
LDLQQFILKHIDSVDHLRALLLLRNEPTRSWGVMEVGARLYLQPRRVSAVLASLEKAGLVRQDSEENFRFAPADPELAQLVEELATLDRERPVTLIKLIYSRPNTLEAFADAFRLRRDD